jgi:hypothetical protein
MVNQTVITVGIYRRSPRLQRRLGLEAHLEPSICLPRGLPGATSPGGSPPCRRTGSACKYVDPMSIISHCLFRCGASFCPVSDEPVWVGSRRSSLLGGDASGLSKCSEARGLQLLNRNWRRIHSARSMGGSPKLKKPDIPPKPELWKVPKGSAMILARSAPWA